MKSLKTRNKSPVHYKYTWQRCTNQSYLFAEGFSGWSWAVPAQHLLSSVATMGRAMPSLRPPGTHPSAAGRSRAHTPCRTAPARCQCHSDLLECIKLRTCPGSGKWISASRSLNALGAWMGPTYHVWSARLSNKGISSSS